MDPSLARAHDARAGVWLIVLAAAGLTFGSLAAPSPTASPSMSPDAVESPSIPPTACPTPSGAPTPSAPLQPTEGATAEPTPTPPEATMPPTASPAASSRPSPSPRPTPHPTPRQTPPAPTPNLTPPPTLAPPSVLVRHGSRTNPGVALTFDMGGRVGDALAIVEWLVDHDVHATIFVTGQMADSSATDAGRLVLGIIDAHPELFTLGNHSYTHRDFRNLTAAQIRDELTRAEQALGASCSQDPRPFFRPPNGSYDADVLAAAGAAGYDYTVTWDVDTIDWRPIANDPPGPTADEIVARVLANARNGSIVLMHLGGFETNAALPRVVDGLRDRGFELVNLDELL